MFDFSEIFNFLLFYIYWKFEILERVFIEEERQDNHFFQQYPD